MVIRIQVEKNSDEISGRPNFSPNFQVNFRVVELIPVQASTSRKVVLVVQSVQDDSVLPDRDELAETAAFVCE